VGFNIVTEYPLWFLVFCVMAGFAYATALYIRDQKNEFGNIAIWSMAILRGIAVALIAFLLLNPMLKSLSKQAEDPIVIFAQTT